MAASSSSAEIPAQYTHSVKIEDTAKGIRLSVHVYDNNLETAVNEAIKLYQSTKQKAERKGFQSVFTYKSKS